MCPAPKTLSLSPSLAPSLPPSSNYIYKVFTCSSIMGFQGISLSQAAWNLSVSLYWNKKRCSEVEIIKSKKKQKTIYVCDLKIKAEKTVLLDAKRPGQVTLSVRPLSFLGGLFKVGRNFPS